MKQQRRKQRMNFWFDHKCEKRKDIKSSFEGKSFNSFALFKPDFFGFL